MFLIFYLKKIPMEPTFYNTSLSVRAGIVANRSIAAATMGAVCSPCACKHVPPDFSPWWNTCLAAFSSFENDRSALVVVMGK